MPKIVDHDERRNEVLEATWRVINRVGLEATTIREIAKEAGYSNGVLAHYFKNKEEIMISAHQLAFQRAGDRIRQRTAGLTGLHALRLALHEALPLDDERLLEAHIDVSFWGQALANERLLGVRTESYVNSRTLWLDLIGLGRESGEIRTRIADEILVDQVLMLVDSLSVEAVLFPAYIDTERQLTLVEVFLERIQLDDSQLLPPNSAETATSQA